MRAFLVSIGDLDVAEFVRIRMRRAWSEVLRLRLPNTNSRHNTAVDAYRRLKARHVVKQIAPPVFVVKVAQIFTPARYQTGRRFRFLNWNFGHESERQTHAGTQRQ